MSEPTRPDPFSEIRLTTLHATRGANFWLSRPVTRIDLTVGAYEDISSADVPGVREALMRTMPGLVEHRCSIGERGGFLVRLARGTYAPHIAEHVALELQTMAGHAVGYGRTRGGDVEGEYTLVFEHVHEAVGIRAAAFALEVVQRAFAGTLDSVDHMVAELRALAATPDTPDVRQDVLCAVSGGTGRALARSLIAGRRGGPDDLVVDVSPSFVLMAGLPFSRAEIAVITDADLTDVPDRYQDEERARRLVSVVYDALPRRGIAIVPADEWDLQDKARDEDLRVAVFSGRDDITVKDKRNARAAAWPVRERIVAELRDELHDLGPLRPDHPAAPQVAAALAVLTLDELAPGTRPVPTLPEPEPREGARAS